MKKIFWLLVFVLVLGAAAPPAAYWLGLENVHGRPASPTIYYSGAEAQEVWLWRKESLPIKLRPITPWHWYELLWCSRNDDKPEDFLTCGDKYPGLRASGFVAKEFLVQNIKNNGLIWRYLSRTAMTIWITRHWSEPELMAELVRLGRLGR